MNEKQAKREEKRQRDYRAAIIQLANYRAKKVVEAALKAQGVRVSSTSPARIRALAEAELKLNWISLMMAAEKMIAMGANARPRPNKSDGTNHMKDAVMRPVRKPNAAYRVREHLTESEVEKLLTALKRNRHGQRDWLIGLLIYRHGLRVSEACDLRWDDIDLATRTIRIRRLKGSTDSTHYLERDELAGLRRISRSGAYVFVNERNQPFGRMGIGRMIERAGEELPFPVHAHMLRHACGYALANKGMDTRRLQHYLGHASITNTVRYTAMSAEPFRDIWR